MNSTDCDAIFQILKETKDLNADYYKGLFNYIEIYEERKEDYPDKTTEISKIQRDIFSKCLTLLNDKKICKSHNFYSHFHLSASYLVSIEDSGSIPFFVLNIEKSYTLFSKLIKKQQTTIPYLEMPSESKHQKIMNTDVKLRSIGAIFTPAVHFIIGEFQVSEKEKEEFKRFDSGNSIDSAKFLIKCLKEIEAVEAQQSESLSLLKILKNRLHRGLSLTIKIEELQEKFRPTERALSTTKASEKKIEIDRFKNLYCCLVTSLQPGHGMTFHGGYNPKIVDGKKVSGHAIVYEIEMQENYLYCFRKVNTGAGNELSIINKVNFGMNSMANDFEAWMDNKSDAKKIVRAKNEIVHIFKDIPLKILVSDQMLSLLLNIENTYDAVSKIENELMKLLGQEPIKEFLFPLQHLGTCPMSSLWGWLKYHLDCIKELSKISKFNLSFLKMSIQNLIEIQTQLGIIHYEDKKYLMPDMKPNAQIDWIGLQLPQIYKSIYSYFPK